MKNKSLYFLTDFTKPEMSDSSRLVSQAFLFRLNFPISNQKGFTTYKDCPFFKNTVVASLFLFMYAETYVKLLKHQKCYGTANKTVPGKVFNNAQLRQIERRFQEFKLFFYRYIENNGNYVYQANF